MNRNNTVVTNPVGLWNEAPRRIVPPEDERLSFDWRFVPAHSLPLSRGLDDKIRPVKLIQTKRKLQQQSSQKTIERAWKHFNRETTAPRCSVREERTPNESSAK